MKTKIKKYRIVGYYKPNWFTFYNKSITCKIEEDGDWLCENDELSFIGTSLKDVYLNMKRYTKEKIINIFCDRNGNFRQHKKKTNWATEITKELDDAEIE